MSRWFRFYSDAMRNPKVMRLADKDFRLWVRLLSIAAENDGKIGPIDDLKLMLNMRLDHLSSGLDRLIRGRLINVLEDGYAPHNWDKFQYKSDTSTERVAKFRAKGNVSETPSETDTEKKEPIANAMDADASTAGQDANVPGTDVDDPIDLKALLFSTGKPYLSRNGVTAANAGSILGKWRQAYGDGAVIDALALAQAESCSAPIPFITKLLENRNGRSGSRPLGGTGPAGQPRGGGNVRARAAAELYAEAVERERAEAEDIGEGGADHWRAGLALSAIAQ